MLHVLEVIYNYTADLVGTGNQKHKLVLNV